MVKQFDGFNSHSAGKIHADLFIIGENAEASFNSRSAGKIHSPVVGGVLLWVGEFQFPQCG